MLPSLTILLTYSSMSLYVAAKHSFSMQHNIPQCMYTVASFLLLKATFFSLHTYLCKSFSSVFNYKWTSCRLSNPLPPSICHRLQLLLSLSGGLPYPSHHVHISGEKRKAKWQKRQSQLGYPLIFPETPPSNFDFYLIDK